jgi:hypothetical protein
MGTPGSLHETALNLVNRSTQVEVGEVEVGWMGEMCWMAESKN